MITQEQAARAIERLSVIFPTALEDALRLPLDIQEDIEDVKVSLTFPNGDKMTLLLVCAETTE